MQAYLLHLVRVRHLSYSTMNQAACAAQLLFQTVLGHGREQFHIPFAKVPAKQPEILAREEIARLFAVCTQPARRMLLQTMYATGLRVSEVCTLRISDIDSAADRMCVRVVCGKGGKGRYSPCTEIWPSVPTAALVRVPASQRVGGVHTLRPCFATQLLEGGVDLHTIQKLLGRKYISTTGRYLHLISPQFRASKEIDPLDLLVGLSNC